MHKALDEVQRSVGLAVVFSTLALNRGIHNLVHQRFCANHLLWLSCQPIDDWRIVWQFAGIATIAADDFTQVVKLGLRQLSVVNQLRAEEGRSIRIFTTRTESIGGNVRL